MSEKAKIFKRIHNSAVVKNPLLFEAVGLCPVVAITLSLKLAVFLAIVTAIELIVCEVLASLLLKNVRRYWRVGLYVLFGVGVIFPIMALVNRFFPDMSMNFGVYLPLMAVNSFVALHCERIAVKNNIKNSFIDALAASMSYGAVAIFTGLFREIFANGTIGGFDLKMPVKFTALMTPFGGLLIIGFLAAAFKGFINKYYPDASPDRAFDTSEVRRSLRGSLKDLMNDEFDPYGVGGEADTPFIRARKEKKAKKDMTESGEAVTVTEKQSKKEKPKKEKTKTAKKTSVKRKTKTADPVSPRRRVESGNSYLDDFSEMLSELEEYKNRSENGDEIPNESKDGGDGE